MLWFVGVDESFVNGLNHGLSSVSVQLPSPLTTPPVMMRVLFFAGPVVTRNVMPTRPAGFCGPRCVELKAWSSPIASGSEVVSKNVTWRSLPFRATVRSAAESTSWSSARSASCTVTAGASKASASVETPLYVSL